MKNSVFQLIKERGKPPADPTESKGSFLYFKAELPDVSFAYDVIRDESALLFCDANIFSGGNLAMVREVLRRNDVLVVPPIVRELQEYASLSPRTPDDAEVVRLIFKDRLLIPTIKIVDPARYKSLLPALCYYVNLILQRKASKGYLEQVFEIQSGKPLTKVERDRLSKSLGGLSKGTSKMANKEGRHERAADELLVVTAMFEAIWLRRNIVILSFDDDVFTQFFKLISLMSEDYLSHLIALDYEARPERYPKRYDLAHYHEFDGLIGDKSNSFAVVKPRDIVNLFPPSDDEPVVTMLKPVERPEIMWTQCLSGYHGFLEAKSRARGSNIDRADGLNCYAQLTVSAGPQRLPRVPLAFFVNDRLFFEDSKEGFRISLLDLTRSLADVEKPIVDFRGSALVWRDS